MKNVTQCIKWDFRNQRSDHTSVLRYAYFLLLRTLQQPFYIPLTVHTTQPLIISIISDHFWCTGEHVLIDILQSFCTNTIFSFL